MPEERHGAGYGTPVSPPTALWSTRHWTEVQYPASKTAPVDERLLRSERWEGPAMRLSHLDAGHARIPGGPLEPLYLAAAPSPPRARKSGSREPQVIRA